MDAGIGQFIPLILIFVIFYFFLIRPQQKKVKDHKAMVEALKRGDKVITSGGIVGTVERVIDNEKVEVKISENVNLEKNFASCLGAIKIIKEGWETEAIPKISNKNIKKIGFFDKIFGIR